MLSLSWQQIKETEYAEAYPEGEATTVFAEELKEYDVSKGTIRLPWNKELPTELIQTIARWCYKEYKKDSIDDDGAY